MGLFAEIDSGNYDGSNYSDTNNSSFSNADDNVSMSPYNSDVLVEGDGTLDFVPTITDSPQVASNGGYGATGTNLLGDAASLIQNAPNIGKQLGTAVGTAQNNINKGITNFQTAQSAAASGNNLSTWWQYASTTDKLMIGLAIVGILVAVKD